jgi:hypothetical protein
MKHTDQFFSVNTKSCKKIWKINMILEGK